MDGTQLGGLEEVLFAKAWHSWGAVRRAQSKPWLLGLRGELREQVSEMQGESDNGGHAERTHGFL